MEELKDASIHHTAIKMVSAVQDHPEYENMINQTKQLVCGTEVDANNFRETLEEGVKNSGLETEIRNVVFQMVRDKLRPENKINCNYASDPLGFLKRAGVQWDRRVRKSLNAMCNELQMPLQGQQRGLLDRENILAKWEELSNYNIELASYRPVYAPKDLLEVLLTLKGPPRNDENTEFVEVPLWEFAHISLPVKNLFQLRGLFNELSRNDIYHTHLEFTYQCQRVLESGHAPLCQHLLKKGMTPAPYRGALWSFVLGSRITTHDIEHFTRLRTNVLHTDHIVDKLVFKDIQLTASNDDQYFVFEDVLYQVMLCFFRDTEVAAKIQEQLESYPLKGKYYEGPPSGVVPFHGICMFAAPFCYLYDTPLNLYFPFRAFYTRYCHRLTTINTHPQGIVSLSLLYEKLLQTHEPQLWSHFREMQIPPIRVVFKWLMRAFSGHLPPDQLLVLWDLILGFDSLELLPLLAIIILSFRKESILQVQCIDAIESILADLSSIKVVPLIILALSRD